MSADDTIASLTARNAALEAALRELLGHVDRNTCTHEFTHRGGSIWTICDECGHKWADDRGGFTPYRDPEPVSAARAALHPSPDDRAKVDDADLLELVEEGVKARLRDGVDIAEECARLLDEASRMRRTRASQSEEASEHTIAIKMAHELEFIAAEIRARFGRPA